MLLTAFGKTVTCATLLNSAILKKGVDGWKKYDIIIASAMKYYPNS